jgi:uncharacterized protein YkwD
VKRSRDLVRAATLVVAGLNACSTGLPPAAQVASGPRLVPTGRAASHYRSSEAAADRAELRADPLREAIVAAVRSLARHDGVAAPKPDARLDAAMNDFARTLGPDDLPAPESVDFVLAHYGLIDPPPHWLLERATPGSDGEMAERTAPPVVEALKSTTAARIGVGVARAATEVRVVVAVQEIDVELRPIPRQMARGARVPIAGRVAPRFREPRLVVTAPDGTVREHAVGAPAADSGFSDEVSCDAGAGHYQVEITGVAAGGPAVLANFPLFCGAPPPRAAPGPAGVRPAPMTVAQAEARLLALVNRDRATAHLAPLALDARLSEIARAHSGDMAAHGFVAHVSPGTGSAADRVARVGLAPQLLLENVGRAYSADDAESGFMASPGHRGNILDGRATRIGIGIAVGPELAGTVPLLVTQLMM